MADNNFFARQELLISKLAGLMIKNLRIMIFGLGAIGCEILKNLVLMGFRHFLLVEMDRIEPSNLSKSILYGPDGIGLPKVEVAARKARELALAEDVDIQTIDGNLITQVGMGVYLEYDIAIIAVDTMDGRADINDKCVLTGTPFFEVGFRGYNGDVCFFAPEGPMQQQDGTIIDKLPTSDGRFPKMLGKFPVCLREEIGTGNFDGTRHSCSGFKVKDKDLEKIPAIQTGAALVAALMCQELVKYLDGKDTLRNKMLLFHGLPLETLVVSYSRNPKCTIHDRALNLVTVPIPRGATIREALQAIGGTLDGDILLSLPDDFILSADCHCCGKKIPIGVRGHEVWDYQRWCPECRAAYPDYASRINYKTNLVKIPREVSLASPEDVLNRRLSDVGVPENDILECIVTKDGTPDFFDVYLKSLDV